MTWRRLGPSVAAPCIVVVVDIVCGWVIASKVDMFDSSDESIGVWWASSILDKGVWCVRASFFIRNDDAAVFVLDLWWRNLAASSWDSFNFFCWTAACWNHFGNLKKQMNELTESLKLTRLYFLLDWKQIQLSLWNTYCVTAINPCYEPRDKLNSFIIIL